LQTDCASAAHIICRGHL